MTETINIFKESREERNKKLSQSINERIKSNPYRVHRAVNWNREVDAFTFSFWEKNLEQMWVDTEFVPSKDRNVWERLDPAIKNAYKRVLGGLTLLDTKQGNVGMPKITEHVDELQRKAVLSFMGMMENIHAKSYSTIFTTLLSDSEIDEVFDWVEENPCLQFKAEQISYYYDSITDNKSLYLAMVASVFLESFLFYSGFFLPLWLSGQGQMVASGEIINKIIQDESIHGTYIGLLGQEVYNKLTPQEQEEVDYETNILLEELMENEFSYTEDIYAPLGLDHEVKNFLFYNANKALMNLGKPAKYEEKKINPIVQNGLNTQSGTHDFFSTKGKSYKKARHRALEDKDFEFPNFDEPLI
ncbi:class 1b ribonucleoside-diphosphate reductase subunit beta [Peribacillus asahii]|uniref:class 1b ribonucleoside-diphosphate reductase subunit beta n=1 Tax=Peribacillus asahii TaxID=228899 RepID=UPI0037F71042